MTNMYRSAKNHQFINIDGMHTSHILNAVHKVRSGTHFYYNEENPVLISLLLELEKRNEVQLKELKEDVARLGYRAQLAERRVEGKPATKPTRSLLADLRAVALRIIRERGLVTADTLREEYKESSLNSFLGLPLPDIGAALPYVFRDKRFKKIGFLRSTFAPNNGRFINVWGSSAAL